MMNKTHLSQKLQPISVAVITKNEQGRLPDCLASCAFADEIVVVDSGSTDDTVAIAKNAGARVFEEKWLGFGPQKQLAIDYCKNRWVLILDADERVPEKTARELTQAMSTHPAAAAFSLPRKNIFLGRWIRHAGWWPDHVARLIDKERCSMSRDRVHESIRVNGQTVLLQEPLLHYATRDLSHTMMKMNRYSSLGGRSLVSEGKKTSYWQAFGRSGWAFCYNYFIRLGFLDGGEGFILAVSDGINKLFKYAKAIEMKRQAGHPGSPR